MNLFDLPETLSPRLAWMAAQGVTFKDRGEHLAKRWTLCADGVELYDCEDENEALGQLAGLRGIRLWNEE